MPQDNDQCQCRIIHAEKVERAKKSLPDLRETSQLASIFKALADPSRLRILMALAKEEMCAVHFLLPKRLRMTAVPVMFGAISMMFSQGGQKVGPATLTLLGGVFLALLCNEGTKLLNQDGTWKFFNKRDDRPLSE